MSPRVDESTRRPMGLSENRHTLGTQTKTGASLLKDPDLVSHYTSTLIQYAVRDSNPEPTD